MILITVELLSRRTGKRTRLGQMEICNKGGLRDAMRGDYVGRLKNCRGKEMTREGHVDNWPRRSYPVWRLVCRMLKEMYPEEK